MSLPLPVPGNRWMRLLLGILLLGGALYILFFHRLTARDLWSSHEARAGMNGQTLLTDFRTGSWDSANPGLPRLFDGRIELQKPPLYYWWVASLGALLGEVNAWAVRLPSALSALGCVLLLAWWGLRQNEPYAGLLSGIILATAVHFTWLARIGRIDMPLTLTVTLAVLAFSAQPTAPRFWKQLLGYLALALGAWLKGPIGILLPGAILFVYFLTEGHLPRPWHWRAWGRLFLDLGLWWGIPLLALLTIPWLIWADVYTNGEFQRVFLWHHNFERGLGGSRLRTHPWWLYIPLFSGDFLPWTPVLFWAGYRTYRLGWQALDRPARLGLVWLLTVLIALSLSSYKRPDYLLPAYPGAALFVGWTLWRWLQTTPFAQRRWASLTALVVAVSIAWWVRVEWYLPMWEPGRDYRTLGQVVRKEAPAPKTVVFFRTEAHALAFHIGRPLTILVQWQELCERVTTPGRHYVICPPNCLEEIRQRLPNLRIEEVIRNTTLANGWHERPLVFLRIEHSHSNN